MGVRAVLFDFHETLISADRWMVLETRGIATSCGGVRTWGLLVDECHVRIVRLV
jgi:hypothetical protein